MLVEPIVESAAWLDRVAATHCTSTDGRSCAWYHRSWQYLRLLGLVSNPSWHTDFFVDELRRAFAGREHVEVLVSGCADYSMFAHVAFALDERVRCTALDWCP